MAVDFYEANKFTMWGWKEEESDTEDGQEDNEGEGDFHEHAVEHECEEQCEAETDVQGQDDAQNIWDGNGNYDQQDNEEERRGK